jgi:Polyketide cyclase / dehydrase and lipid transport
MAKLGMSSRVEAPPEELFDLLADPGHETLWNPDVVEVHRLDAGPIGVGSRWQGRYKGIGTMDITLREYERPHRLAFAVSGSRMDMSFAFALAPADTATNLVSDADIRPKGAMRLMSPLVGPMMRRTFAKRPAQMAEGVAKLRAARA